MRTNHDPAAEIAELTRQVSDLETELTVTRASRDRYKAMVEAGILHRIAAALAGDLQVPSEVCTELAAQVEQAAAALDGQVAAHLSASNGETADGG